MRLIVALTVASILSCFSIVPAAGKVPVKTPDPHEHIEEILERPPYQYWKLRQERTCERVESTIIEAVLGTFKEMLRSLVDKISGWLKRRRPRFNIPRLGSGAMNMMAVLEAAGWIALSILLAFLAVLAYRLAREGRFKAKGARILSREQVREALDAGDALALDGRGWIDQADRLAAEKEFRAVFRALYLALLSGLHSAGKIDFRVSRTNWTYVRRFRGDDEEREIFARLTEIFDQVWYGFKDYGGNFIIELRRDVVRLVGGGNDHA